MIEISNVNKKYHSKANEEVVAIDGINLKFNHNGLVFILGKSGSGKSTFLNILGGLDSANTSKIHINHKKLNRFDETTCSEYRNTYIGFVFQEYNLLDDLNVYDNIALALEMQNRVVDRETVLNILKEVDLEGLEERELDELSGGQKQRVAIARALVKKPEIILADEPTGNLDSETSEQVFELFKRISKDKLIICVSHDAEYAHKYGDRIIEISDGKIIRDTNPEVIEDDVQAPEMIRPVLPKKFIYHMSIGNILNNKLRMIVTSVIVAFLMAILTAVYTTLNVSSVVDVNLLKESQLNHLLLKPRNVESAELNQSQLSIIQSILPDYDAIMYKRLAVLNGEQTINISSLPFTSLSVNALDSDNTKFLSDSYLDTIKELPLQFVELGINSEVYESIIGSQPNDYNEIVISSYLADLIIKAGLTIDNTTLSFDSYQDIISKAVSLNISGKELKIVGITKNLTPVLDKETIVLDTVFANIYVQRGFISNSAYATKLLNYGVFITNYDSLPDLMKEVKNAGYISLTPIYSDALENFTRFELSLLISVFVPLIGYLALVFLANYVSSSIIYRKKQIGILRAMGNFISNVEHVFRLEAIIVGLVIMVLAYFLTPYFVNIMNFAYMVHFSDSFISFYHYSIFSPGISNIIEIFMLLTILITVLTFTLTHNINLIDPVDVINGR
ncbi:MAG TPA: ABC transporter ATP-binding protein/permease [Erysipelotrichaceae bacterium]|nr:ABC transporter ATP-binding protein/permease [Erysipelotrichaceae bacterium]